MQVVAFALENGVASWTDTTGPGTAAKTEPTLYIPQNGSPYALAVYARALLADADQTLPASLDTGYDAYRDLRFDPQQALWRKEA